MSEKKYIAIVQCHIVMERCSGYFCESAYTRRSGEFARYPADEDLRTVYITCGGCCGRAVHRKLWDLITCLKEKEQVDKQQVVVHLASCITKDNFHGPVCPHLDYLKELISGKLSLDIVEGTNISDKAEKLRQKGKYKE